MSPTADAISVIIPTPRLSQKHKRFQPNTPEAHIMTIAPDPKELEIANQAPVSSFEEVKLGDKMSSLPHIESSNESSFAEPTLGRHWSSYTQPGTTRKPSDSPSQ